MKKVHFSPSLSLKRYYHHFRTIMRRPLLYVLNCLILTVPFLFSVELHGQPIPDTTLAKQQLLLAESLFKNKDYKKAEKAALIAKALFEKRTGAKSKGCADALNWIGRIRRYDERAKEGLSADSLSLAIRQVLFDSLHLDIAQSHMSLGLSHFRLESYRPAQQHFEKALRIRVEAYDIPNIDIAKSHRWLGNSLLRQNEFDAALNHYAKGLAICEAINTRDKEEGIYLQNSKALCLSYMGRYEEALKMHHHILLARKADSKATQADIGQTYNNIAICHIDRSMLDSGIYYLNLALEIYKKLPPPETAEIGRVYQNLSNCHFYSGDIDLAIALSEKALSIYTKIYPQGHSEIGKVYVNLGNCHYLNGNYDIADSYFTKALPLLLETDTIQQIRTFNSIANNNYAKKDINAAAKYYEQAQVLSSRLLNVHPESILPYANMGGLYHELGDYKNAVKSYQQALTLAEQTFGEKYWSIPVTLNNLGSTYLTMGRYEEALDAHERAASLSAARVNSDYLGALAASGVTWYKRYREDGDIKNAYRAAQKMRQAIQVMQQQRLASNTVVVEQPNLIRETNSERIFTVASDAYAALFEQSANPSFKDSLFLLAEQAKYAVLLDAFRKARAEQIAGVPSSFLNREREIQRKMRYLQHLQQLQYDKYPEMPNDSLIAAYGAQGLALRDSLNLISDTISTIFPQYAQLVLNPRFPKASEIGQMLSAKQTLVEYMLGDSLLHIYVINRDTFEWHTVVLPAALPTLVDQLRFGLTGYYSVPEMERSSELYDTTTKQYIAAARALYALLVKPVDHLIGDSTDLIIIPDGLLSYIPFEVLLTDSVENRSRYGNYPYLLRKHHVSYAYSAALWQEMRTKIHEVKPAHLLGGFAPMGSKNTVTFLDNNGKEHHYPPLPAAIPEVNQVCKILGDAHSYTLEKANKSSFEADAYRYRILLVSAHSISDERGGDYTFLILASPDKNVKNGFLYIRDIYNLRLNADLVFLSACHSNSGKLSRSEGCISLARAFAYAGAKSLISSIWGVTENPGKELTVRFFGNLKVAGISKSAALCRAKLDFLTSPELASFRHPYFWAGFILVGDGAPVFGQ